MLNIPQIPTTFDTFWGAIVFIIIIFSFSNKGIKIKLEDKRNKEERQFRKDVGIN